MYLFLYVYVHVCMYAHTCVSVCMRVYACMYIAHAYKCVFVHVYTCVHMCVCACVFLGVHVFTHAEYFPGDSLFLHCINPSDMTQSLTFIGTNAVSWEIHSSGPIIVRIFH